MESLRQTLEVNVVGVHAMIQAFLPLLQAGQKKTVINISSGSGSLSQRYEEVVITHIMYCQTHMTIDIGCDLSAPLTAVLCRHTDTQYAKEYHSKAVPILSPLLSLNVNACCVVHHAEG